MNKIIEKKQVSHICYLRASAYCKRFQMQDFMRLYSGLVDRCFNACVHDFTSRTLMSKEVSPLWT